MCTDEVKEAEYTGIPCQGGKKIFATRRKRMMLKTLLEYDTQEVTCTKQVLLAAPQGKLVRCYSCCFVHVIDWENIIIQIEF